MDVAAANHADDHSPTDASAPGGPAEPPPRRPRRAQLRRWSLRIALIVFLVYGGGYVALRSTGTIAVTDDISHRPPGDTGHVGVFLHGTSGARLLDAAGVRPDAVFSVYGLPTEIECRLRDLLAAD